jgi:hypothetical protein
VITRRALLGGFASYPLIALVSSPSLIAACGSRPPETPLAHLYGHEWVAGAYKLYASKYADVQTSAETSSADAYRVLAQKGIVALDGLQARDVPFFIRVDKDADSFAVRRKVPERLTFTADMNDADRKSAEAAWKKARDHVHSDYEEIRRLDWALTRLLSQLQHVRNAIEEGRIEQYRLVEQLAELKKDPKELPYELPYQVTRGDYEDILLLLLERLEDDRGHLSAIESDIIAVGMTTRATDAGSATMAASIRKVLLAVVEDGQEKTRPPLYPEAEDERKKQLAAARDLAAKIEASPEFQKWKKEEAEKRLAAIGAFLTALDAMTGLPTSQIYKTVLGLFRGDNDYLAYLKTIAGFVPAGSAVLRVVNEALEYTDKARRIAGTVVATVKTVEGGGVDALVAQAKAQALAQASAQAKGVVLNTASKFALDRAEKQLSFFKEKAEIDKVSDLLAQTDLVRQAMPSLPSAGPQ